MRTVFLFIFLCLLTTARASERWVNGSLVLKTREVRVGEMQFFPVRDVVVIRSEGKVDVFPAARVESLRFYDADDRINRRFVTFTPDGRAARFYEVVVDGPMPVLRRQRLELQCKPSDVDDFNYYVLKEGQLVGLRQFRARIYPTLRGSMSGLRGFVRGNRLNPDLDADVIRILQYYNERTTSDPVFTRA